MEPELGSFLEKDFENELVNVGLRIGEHEDKIRLLECQQRNIESNLLDLKASRNQTPRTSSYDSPTKNEIATLIESKPNTAAALVMKFLREVSEQDCYGFMGHIIGVVALLGTTPTLELSRIFAKYLGDQMLAVVCKSYEDVRLLETYEKLNQQLGQSINGLHLVLCIEDIRACEASKDVEGNLILPNPTLPDGTTPAGFLGYAVNMIDIDYDHLNTRTNSGYGLRETLFYRLFGETQVYESKQDMKRAISCIKHGAFSLDGGILRGNGAMSFGCWEPDIIFPIDATRNEVKLKLTETMDQFIKEKESLESTLKNLEKIVDKYGKYFMWYLFEERICIMDEEGLHGRMDTAWYYMVGGKVYYVGQKMPLASGQTDVA